MNRTIVSLTGPIVACVLLALIAPASASAQGQQPPPQASGQQLTPQELDKLLAPIALYPDALVVQILQCAQSPYQIKQVCDWLEKNPDLKGTAAQDAAQKQGFDASFIAMVIFPDVLKDMNSKPDWTRQLGQAFNTDKDAVFSSIQRLRAEAQKQGNLKSNDKQTVDTTNTSSGAQVISIEPANPQVVYVPTYNPTVVYTQPASTVVYDDNSGDVAAAAVVGFTAGVIIGAVADNDHDHYYYGYGGWGYHRPICYPGGYDDFYDHRENMANDYYNHRQNMANDFYDHRENMAGDVRANQGQRQQAISQNQANRQAAGGQFQQSRQNEFNQAQANRSQNMSNRQSAYQSGANQRGTTTTRGAYNSPTPPYMQSGMNSNAFSSYQRGSTERYSSQRGNSSMNRSYGGGGRSYGGGRRGGGRRR